MKSKFGTHHKERQPLLVRILREKGHSLIASQNVAGSIFLKDNKDILKKKLGIELPRSKKHNVEKNFTPIGIAALYTICTIYRPSNTHEQILNNKFLYIYTVEYYLVIRKGSYAICHNINKSREYHVE